MRLVHQAFDRPRARTACPDSDASGNRTGDRPAPDRSSPGETNRILENARREFAGVFGDQARGKRNWQVMAFTLAGLLGAVTLAYVRLASASRLVPYVMQVDRLGQIQAAGVVAERASPDGRLVASELARFVRSVRTVLPAPAAAAQTELLEGAYAFVGPEVAAFLNTYFADPRNDPRVLGAQLTRQVRVTSVLRVPRSDTWTLRWTETETPAQTGEAPHTTAWEGYATTTLVAPRAETVQDNPLGLYLTSLTWTQVTTPVGPGGTP